MYTMVMIIGYLNVFFFHIFIKGLKKVTQNMWKKVTWKMLILFAIKKSHSKIKTFFFNSCEINKLKSVYGLYLYILYIPLPAI